VNAGRFGFHGSFITALQTKKKNLAGQFGTLLKKGDSIVFWTGIVFLLGVSPPQPGQKIYFFLDFGFFFRLFFRDFF